MEKIQERKKLLLEEQKYYISKFEDLQNKINECDKLIDFYCYYNCNDKYIKNEEIEELLKK